MRVVVTGSNGFIGSAVCRELKERGHEPVVFDRANGQDVRHDPLPSADHVIHLAGVLGTAELFYDPALAVDVNVKGTLNVLLWCQRTGAGYTGITMPPVFPSVYTATKMCADRLAEAWRINYEVPTSYVRAFNAYGPGQKHGAGHPRKIIPAFSTEAWAGDPLVVWGDGGQTVDLIHTDDLARMLVDATGFGGGQVFDGGTGKAWSVNAVADMVIAITGSKSHISHRPMRCGEVPTEIVATGEGWDLLGWRPEFRIEQLVDAVTWYQP
jgi:UDP-glucose 4-epimerase